MSTASSSHQRYDAWKQWSRRVRRNHRSYAISSLISETYVDPDVYKFMQIEIRFHGDGVIQESMLLKRGIGTIDNGNMKEGGNTEYLGIYVPTTAIGKRSHGSTAPTIRIPQPTPHVFASAEAAPNTTTTEAPTKHFPSATSTVGESKENEEDEEFLLPQASTGLLRVSTSMVLDVQQCLFSQIQLERQEHHLPPFPVRHQHRKHRHGTMPPLPPAEASNASSLSNSNNSTPANSTASSSNKDSMVATCLICPAAVHVPSSKHALVYCTNCTTLATASLLRKQAARSAMTASAASPCVSAVSDLSSSIV